jgi:hypothetical protein
MQWTLPPSEIAFIPSTVNDPPFRIEAPKNGSGGIIGSGGVAAEKGKNDSPIGEIKFR